MSAAERLAHLKQSRAAAIAVRDEMDRRNDSDPRPSNVLKRAPILRRAAAEIVDVDLKINDLDDHPRPIALDPDGLVDLDRLADRLNAAIARDALVGVALDTVTRVLEAATEVRGILS